MKKFLIFLSAILMVAALATAEVEPVATSVPLAATFAPGLSITITPGTATWVSVPMATSPEELNQMVLSDEGVQSAFVAFRLETGRKAQLVCESSEILGDGGGGFSPNLNLKHIWSGDITFESMFPAVGVEQTIFTSVNRKGYLDCQVQFLIKNSDQTINDTYRGTLMITLMDVPS